MASSLGKMPTTSVRRLISPFSRSIGLVTGMTVAVPSDPAAVFFQPRRIVRPSGTGAPGARKCGQAIVQDELDTRKNLAWRGIS